MATAADSKRIGFKTRLIVALLLLRETVLHPLTTSRIIIDPITGKIVVERD